MFEVPDHDAIALEDALGAPAGGLLLRRRDRPGRRPQLPARLHGDDRRLPARLMEELRSWSPGRWPRTSGPATSPPRRSSPRRTGAGADRPEAARRGVRARRRGRGVRAGGAEGVRAARGRGRVARRGPGGRRDRRRPGPRAARRRAHGAQPARPPLGDRDADRALRRARSTAGADDPRHPQDDARPARAREGRGRRRRRAQPPHGPRRRDPDQGEPRRARRRPGAGGRRRAEAQPGWRSRSSAATWPRSRRRSRPAPTGCCSTTWASPSCARRSPRATRPAAPGSRHRAGVTLENVAEVAATGVDFISVGALTHSAPALDLSMLLDG